MNVAGLNWIWCEKSPWGLSDAADGNNGEGDSREKSQEVFRCLSNGAIV
jgi:hypothetical protein